MMEFHISRLARERYQFEETLFSYTGNVVFANIAACRSFAHRMNTVREVEKHPEQAVHAGQLYAMGLIDEASHVLMARYREQFDPEVMTSALEWFSAQVGAEALDKLLLTFVEQFPGLSVIRGDQTPKQWLESESGGMPNRAAALEEMLLLWTANRNEAFRPFDELFEAVSYTHLDVYKRQRSYMPWPLSLTTMHSAPASRSTAASAFSRSTISAPTSKSSPPSSPNTSNPDPNHRAIIAVPHSSRLYRDEWAGNQHTLVPHSLRGPSRKKCQLRGGGKYSPSPFPQVRGKRILTVANSPGPNSQ